MLTNHVRWVLSYNISQSNVSIKAIQPCLALLFGRYVSLTQLRDLKCDFRLITVMNTFFQVATVYKSDQDNPELIERFNIAKDDFRDGGKRDCVSVCI